MFDGAPGCVVVSDRRFPRRVRVNGDAIAMTDQQFAATVSRRLHPMLASRGFPYAAEHNGASAPGEPATRNATSVLFHCDGPSVEDVLVRFPVWRDPLYRSYGSADVSCLDLWVQLEDGHPVWSFEVFEPDVAIVAGEHAMRRLRELSGGPLEEWVDQLAVVLDAYFQSLEASGGAADS